MKNRTEQENYRLFSVLLLEEKVYLDPTLRFKDICRWLGADEKSLADMLMKELGVTGDDLLKKYRESDMKRLAEKYDLAIKQ